MSRIFILLPLFISLVSDSIAQPYIDPAIVYYSYSPGKGLQDNKALEAFNHLRAQLNIPVVMKKDSSTLLISPAWEHRRIRLNENGAATDVNSLLLILSLTKRIHPKWSVTIGIIPRWNGESHLLFSNGFQLGGAFYFTRNIKPLLKVRAGLYYNREFFGHFFMPIVGIEWKINARNYLFGNMPNSLTWENRINRKFSWGAVFRTFPNSYRLEPVFPTRRLDYYRITDIQTGIYGDIYILPKLVLTMEAGYALFRKLRLGGESFGGSDTEITISDKGNIYLRASLQYRMRFY